MRSEELHDLVPFSRTLGIEIEHARPDEVAGSVSWAPDRCTAAGMLHGGVLMALADTLGAVCAYLNLPEGAKGTTTIESKTNFFRGVSTGVVAAVTRPLHVGRRTIVVQSDLRDDAGGRVAQVTQTQAVL